ncbi:Stemmadenine O-acetyltransferase [Linum perenne]
MEVEVISVETIKPTTRAESAEVEKPSYKLSFADQLMMRSYFGIVIFYPPPANMNEDGIQNLKSSLSKTLDTFYPLSGRIKDNLTVDDFQSGVPFTETRVKGCNSISEFLKCPDLKFLNQLSPVETFALTTKHDEPQPPPVVVQINVFPCGGIALGFGFNHKVVDGATVDEFLNTWASIGRTGHDDHLAPKLLIEAASSVFPPRQSIPPEIAYVVDASYHQGRRTSTRRFVFDSQSIAALKLSGKSSQIQNPSRTEAVLAFIWKSVRDSAPTVELSPKLLLLGVNLRSRMQKLRDISSNKEFSFGNLVTMAGAMYNADADTDTDAEMGRLVQLIRTGVAGINEHYLSFISNSEDEKALQAVVGALQMFEQMGSQLLTTSSWIRFCFSDVDFGFGKPVWTSVIGEASDDYPSYGNMVILTESIAPQQGNISSNSGRGIEAWVRLDADVMALLEQNSDFTQFASVNPAVLF